MIKFQCNSYSILSIVNDYLIFHGIVMDSSEDKAKITLAKIRLQMNLECFRPTIYQIFLKQIIG